MAARASLASLLCLLYSLGASSSSGKLCFI